MTPPKWRTLDRISIVVDGLALLLLLAVAWKLFGWLLGDSLYVYGDNPGQFARLWFGEQYGVLGWVPEWYAGYPELHFYPPGFVIIGRALARLHPGGLQSDYNFLLFFAALLPAWGCYTFCRIVAHSVRRVPHATAAGMSAGLVAGLMALLFPVQWGGAHALPIGLVGERLAFGLVPFVLAAGWLLVEQARLWHIALCGSLLALLLLTHPFHTPAAVAAILLYALARRSGSRVWWRLLLMLLYVLALVAWWLLPLLLYTQFASPMVRADLAQTMMWLDAPPAPLLRVAAVAALPGLLLWKGERAVPYWAPTVAVLALLVLLLPLGIWLGHTLLMEWWDIYLFDPIRFIAEYYLALILLTGLAAALPCFIPLTRGFPLRLLFLVAGVTAMVVLGRAATQSYAQIGGGPREESPHHLATVAAHPALSGLWEALAEGEGRVLYTSYYLRLEEADGTPLPTALKSLSSYFSGRDQVGGTFSHWSPVARLLWTGDAATQVLPERVELEDDRSFLGIAWEALDEAHFTEIARALNVGTIVAAADDLNARTFLDRSPTWQSYWNNGHFFLYRPLVPPLGWGWTERGVVAVERVASDRWQVQVGNPQAPVLHLSLAYFPFWQATSGGEQLPLHRNEMGLTDVELEGAEHVLLRWTPPLFIRLLAQGAVALSGIVGLAALYDFAAALWQPAGVLRDRVRPYP